MARVRAQRARVRPRVAGQHLLARLLWQLRGRHPGGAHGPGRGGGEAPHACVRGLHGPLRRLHGPVRPVLGGACGPVRRAAPPLERKLRLPVGRPRAVHGRPGKGAQGARAGPCHRGPRVRHRILRGLHVHLCLQVDAHAHRGRRGPPALRLHLLHLHGVRHVRVLPLRHPHPHRAPGGPPPHHLRRGGGLPGGALHVRLPRAQPGLLHGL
mmetsp:Transcript_25526/g.85560  ORF Transcript_25526/g.85560 Transcript_25526/m.85560 type:complete len:211 (+) Transcript_25526:509-1141(+)